MDYKLRHYHQRLDTTLQGYADSSVPGIIEQTRIQLSVIMDMILLQHIASGFHSISHALAWATPRYILNISAPKLCHYTQPIAVLFVSIRSEIASRA